MNVQAVVLVGGQGVRLQPLTLTTPKPLVPLANRPLIEHIVSWLERSGVEHVYLLTHFRAAAFGHWLQQWRGIPVQTIEEPVPLGTAGAVANVRHQLGGTTAVINGDNITNLDLRAMFEQHRVTGARVTIAVDQVEDPTGRGVVVVGGDERISRFQEKPAPGTALACTVNTGSYVIEPEVLNMVPVGSAAMWETDLFPRLAESGGLYAFRRHHLWLDAGTPPGYFTALQAVLMGELSAPAGQVDDGVWREPNSSWDAGACYEPPIVLGSGAIVAAGATLVGPVSVGRECHVLAGTYLERSAVWDGSMVEPRARIKGSIVGYNCHIGQDAVVEDVMLGDGVIVRPGAHVAAGSRVAPGTIVESERA
jgi:NDP-sugar pyrophosphorylase family protein